MALQAPVLEAVQAAGPAEFKHVSRAAAGTGPRFGVGAAGFPQVGAGSSRFLGEKTMRPAWGPQGEEPGSFLGEPAAPLAFQSKTCKNLCIM